jgi:hypothetical protein
MAIFSQSEASPSHDQRFAIGQRDVPGVEFKYRGAKFGSCEHLSVRSACNFIG